MTDAQLLSPLLSVPVLTGPLLALTIAGVALLAFAGGYLIGHWHADPDRYRDDPTQPEQPNRPARRTRTDDPTT
jgi:hypothetical protein